MCIFLADKKVLSKCSKILKQYLKGIVLLKLGERSQSNGKQLGIIVLYCKWLGDFIFQSWDLRV